MKKFLSAIFAVIIFCAVMLIPVGGKQVANEETVPEVESVDLSEYSKEPPSKQLNLLFIHHSCGGQLLADPGENQGRNCIYQSHPNGGGLRGLLEEQGYVVNEASYGSEVGSKTDIFDWLPKFRDKMEQVLKCSGQDTSYPKDKLNDIVAFKSCFPNNNFSGKGAPPGNPEGPELTVWNAKAAYKALLEEFRKYPEVLFVCVTAPPLVGRLPPEPLCKQLARKVLKKPRSAPSKSGPLAREFNNWLKSTDGWLRDYGRDNVAVFDYYDILTAEGKSNYCEYPTGGGSDSHPSREGNRLAAEAFIPFLNRAVRKAGLTE